MSFSNWELVSEISRALEPRNAIRHINVGTSPHMRRYHNVNREPLRWTLSRLVGKCPHLQNIILHGLDIRYEDLEYILKHLPTTLKGIDLARNPVNDDNMRQLMTRCPNLIFLDVSETKVTHLILTEIPAT